jgi:DNA-binding transcriptional ArsR family regulator
MDSLAALADPTRRRIVEMLAHGNLSSGEIAESFRISAPAISQHLKALRHAGLVRVRVDAQRRIYELDCRRLDEMSEWVLRIRRACAVRLERLPGCGSDVGNLQR